MKTLWICVAVVVTAATLSATQFSYTNSDGGSAPVTVSNPQSSAVAIKSVAVSLPFSQTSDCSTLAPGASCTIVVSWGGGGVQLGTLTVIDSSGIPQYVGITGE